MIKRREKNLSVVGVRTLKFFFSNDFIVLTSACLVHLTNHSVAFFHFRWCDIYSLIAFFWWFSHRFHNSFPFACKTNKIPIGSSNCRWLECKYEINSFPYGPNLSASTIHWDFINLIMSFVSINSKLMNSNDNARNIFPCIFSTISNWS